MSSIVHVVKGRVVTPTRVIDGGRVIIDDDTIVAVLDADAPPHALESRAKTTVDVGNDYVMPGFVDIHNHGLGGCDEVMDHWQHPRFTLSRLLQCGTLSVAASVIFSSKRAAAVAKTIETIESVVATPERAVAHGAEMALGSVIEGIHAEGPVIESAGGLPETDRGVSLQAFQRLCKSMPSLRIMTISPAAEAREGYKRLSHLTTIGVRASLGHDKVVSEPAIIGALEVLSKAAQGKAGGITDHVPHLTHVYNVMNFHHRQPGLVNFALCRRLPAHPRYAGCTVGSPTTEIIGDLIHVHPVSISSLMSARDPTKDIALISDCISSYEPGRRLKYNGRAIMVKAEGGCYLIDPMGQPTSTLAGSTVTLADQLHTLMKVFGLDVVTACNMLASTPARVARIDDRVGSLAAGRKANLLVVTASMEAISRRMVYGCWADDESLGPYRMLRPTMPSSL